MKQLTTIISAVLFLLISSCNSQKKEVIEIKNKLNKSITSMQSTLDYFENGFIMIPTKSEVNKRLQDNDFDEEFKISDSTSIKKGFEEVFKKASLQQSFEYPLASSILVKKDLSPVSKLLRDYQYFREYDEERPKFIPIKIVFKNKTKKTSSFDFDGLDGEIFLKNAKPVESVTFKIDYQFPVINKFEFNKNSTKTNIDSKEIILKEIKDNKATFIIPEHIKNNIIAINGIYKDGRVLRNLGESSKSIPSKEKRLFIKKMIAFQKQVVNKIENKDFKTIEEIKSFITKNTPKTAIFKKNLLKTTSYTFHFSGDIKSINIFMKTKNSFQQKTVVINRVIGSSTFINEKDKYFVVNDTVTWEEGLIDLNGKLIIKPKYDKLSVFNNHFFEQCIVNEKCKLYWLNTRKKRLEEVDYELTTYMSSAKYNYYQKYLLIENQERQGDMIKVQYGVVNCVTGKIVVPIKYDDINIIENKIHTNKNSKKETFSLNGVKLK
ncbi:WG repeat-containing protein [Tenacibaculum sp. SDUM215027]|uniref:WG repeat-containing protein n=1 Tax=Tenacibaculum sp. SDUM215027 TaxID=3422596 RepID=UPI003D31CBA5